MTRKVVDYLLVVAFMAIAAFLFLILRLKGGRREA